MTQRAILVLAVGLGLGYGWLRGATVGWSPRMATFAPSSDGATARPVVADGGAHACFAGGCYWSTQARFEDLPGVTSVVAGHVDGREGVWISFDPARTSYEALLEHFWRGVDPFAIGGQFCDLGEPYRAAVHAVDAESRRKAEASKRALDQRLGRPVSIPIVEGGSFVPAPEPVQHFARRHPIQYGFYDWSCGRQRRLTAIWAEERRP